MYRCTLNKPFLHTFTGILKHIFGEHDDNVNIRSRMRSTKTDVTRFNRYQRGKIDVLCADFLNSMGLHEFFYAELLNNS